ncbi:MAG: hypothetical protein WBC04_14630 [Candidatus Acidiferrales bacterium]
MAGRPETTGPVVNYQGQPYEPAPIDATLLHAMTLPTGTSPYGSARELLHGIAQEVNRFSALPERFVSEVSWTALSTWFLDVTASAPSLSILGSETIAGNQLFRLLGALCRRALTLSAARFTGVCSLLTGWQPTLLIRHAHFDRDVERVLSAARKPGEYVPLSGRLVELHSAVVTLSELDGARLPPQAVLRIPILQTQSPVVKLEQDIVEKIEADFQPRLLAYRRENHAKVQHSPFDAPMLDDLVRELACCLGACTPDGDLQAELLKVLQPRNTEYLSAKSTDFNAVVVEALLFYSHERSGGKVYVGEVAETVQTILAGRGEPIEVTPHSVGHALDDLGLQRELRRKKGYPVVLTLSVRRRIHGLARQIRALPFADGIERCELCRSDGPTHDLAAAETRA